jgi:hypothetical protein
VLLALQNIATFGAVYCNLVLMMSSEVGRDSAWNNSIPARKAGQDGVRLIEIKEIHKNPCFLLQNDYEENNAETTNVKTIYKTQACSH